MTGRKGSKKPVDMAALRLSEESHEAILRMP
jgi:hypothetical protein